MKRNTLLSLTVLFVLAACSREAESGATPEPADETATPEALVVATTPPVATDEPVAELDEPAEGVGGGGEGLVVTQSHTFVDQFNTWRIVGEVRNNSDTPQTSVELLFEIRNAEGAAVLNDVTSLLVANLAPSGTAPFSYTINDPSITPDDYDVFVTGSAPADITPVTLDVINTSLIADDFGDFHCTGEVVNNTGAPADLDGLAAAVVDAEGNVLTADWFWAVARHLEPGASSPFRASPFGPADTAAACRIYVDARQSDPLPAYNVEVLSTRFYRDSFQTGHLVGEVRNNESQTLTVQLIAGLYAADGRVLDADFATVPIAVNPGETASFDFTTLSATNYSQQTFEAVDTAVVLVDPFWTYAALTEQANLSVDNINAAGDGSSVLLTGDVVNNQQFNAEFTVIAARFRDAAGAVVAQGYTSIFDPIPAGASAPFDMRVYLPLDIDVTELSYEIVAKTDLPQ